MQKEGVLIVPKSSHHAFELERLLGQAGIGCMVIPTPKTLSGECGVSLLVDERFLEEAASVLQSEWQDTLQGIYLMPTLTPLSLAGALS